MDDKILNLVINALKEDIPTVDVSTEYLFTDEMSTGKFIAKENGVISGLDICELIFKTLDQTTVFTPIKSNGDEVAVGDVIASVTGKTKSVLQSERVALNFLQRMSGVASMTRLYVNETKGYKARILDTRKTTPLLRVLEKRAVVDGGGENHRMSLSDMVMLKDNHIAAAGSIKLAVEKVRNEVGKAFKIEVEIENIDQFYEALNSDCDIIMLDNMSNALMAKCVSINNGKKKLEASGNMTIERIRSVCETGVDYISVGAVTHSYPSLDISLKF